MSATITHYATGTWLDGDNPTATKYADTTMRIGQQSERANVILNFDVSTLKASTVVQSILKFTASGIGGGMVGSTERTIYAYRLDEGFTNNEATWVVSATGTDWTGGNDVGAANNSAITQYSLNARRKLQASVAVGFRVTDATELDITELVKDALNRHSGTLLLWVGIPLSDTVTTDGYALVKAPADLTETNRPKIETIVATRIVWDGAAGDGDVQTATNWVGDVIPDNYDFAIFNDGAEDVTTNYSAIVANSLFIGENYTGTMEQINGDPVSFLVVATVGHPQQNKVVINKKEGRFHLAASNAEIETFIQNTASEVPSEIRALTQDNSTVYVSKNRNQLTLSGNRTFKDIILSNESGGGRDVIIECLASPLKAARSKVTVESALGEFVLFRNTRLTSTSASTEIASTGTSWIVGNSIVKHGGTTTSAEINIARGELTFKDNEHGNITTNAIVLWKGGTFDPRTEVGAWNSTVSPEIDIKGGGNFAVDIGRTIAIIN